MLKYTPSSIVLLICGLSGLTLAADPPATRPAAIVTTRPSRFSRPAEQELKFQEAVLQYTTQALPEAEAKFRALTVVDPADSESYYYLGLALLDQNKAQDSIASFDQAIRLDPTLDEARAARATANIRAQHFDAVDADLNTLTDPKWKALVAYLRGQKYYGEGKLDQAAAAFAEAKALGSPESAPAQFYEGLTYIRMKELVRARQSFRDGYRTGAERDPTLASASRQLDAVLAAQERAPTKPWEFQLTAGYGYDSNVVQIGQGIDVPAGISNQGDWGFVLQPRGSYSFYRTEKVEAGIEANGYFTFHNDLTDFDTESYQAGPFINVQLRENLYGSMRYGFNYVGVGYEQFLTRQIVTPQLTLVEPKFGYTSGYYQFQAKQYQGDPGSPEFDRDGVTQSVGVVQGIALPALFVNAEPANLELSCRYENQQTKGSDFDSNLFGFGATLYAPLPFWGLRADIGATADWELFDNGNSLDANDSRRRDFEYALTAGVTKEFSKNVAVRLDYSYTDHLSNVETTADQKPYQFDRYQVGLRFIFSF